jgi:hypothetical protein
MANLLMMHHRPFIKGAMVMDTLQQGDHKVETKQEKDQEPISLREQLKNCFPKDLNALLYALFVLVYLVCAVVHFVRTGDVTMLETLLPYLSAYAGIHKVAYLQQSKNEGKQQM